MLSTPNTFSGAPSFSPQMGAIAPNPGFPNSHFPVPATPMPNVGASQMDQVMGNPQTMSYARGGATKARRTSLVEVYMSPDEIEKMFEAQGQKEFDKLTGRPVFKKLSRFIENPHIERAIRARFANGGMAQPTMGGIMGVIDQARQLGMPRPGYAHGGSTSYSMPTRSGPEAENYAEGGDTTLVYITPHMQRLFDDLGGRSRNTINGKPQYFGLSDIWNGLKSIGSSALGGLNAVAPQLAKAASPLIDQYVPSSFRGMAHSILDAAPGVISSLNNYVNPGAASSQQQGEQPNQAAQQNLNAFNELPFAGEEGMQELPQSSPQHQNPTFRQNMGRFASDFASQFNNPMGRAAHAGIESQMGGRNWRQTGANMFNAASAPQRAHPAVDIARSGANMFGSGQGGMSTLQNMGQQAYNQFMGRPRRATNNDRRALESQYLDQIYKNPNISYA